MTFDTLYHRGWDRSHHQCRLGSGLYTSVPVVLCFQQQLNGYQPLGAQRLAKDHQEEWKRGYHLELGKHEM